MILSVIIFGLVRIEMFLRSLKFLKFYDFSSKRLKSFITTPIFYVNADPHIGHLFSAVLADSAHRWKLIKAGNAELSNYRLSTGVDEHGIKVQTAAERANKDPLSYCDYYSSRFKVMFDRFGISYTDFVRTTDPSHKRAVEAFWKRLLKKGLIQKGDYEGWYSTIDECFYTEKDIHVKLNGETEIKVAKETGSPVEWIKEENYILDLSPFQHKIRDWLMSSNVIQPAKYLPVALQLLRDDLRISISRNSNRLAWGISVPNDATQTIYVWFDALINYLTVAGFPNDSMQLWPPNIQVLGKDILKFHAIYWPSFLLAAELPLPSRLFIHAHWLVDGVKMSKSLGNVIEPNKASEILSVDGLRYFLLKQGAPNEDTNFTFPKAVDVINADLVNNIGNLLSRCTVTKINPDQKYPDVFDLDTIDPELRIIGAKLIEALDTLLEKVGTFYDSLLFYKGLELIAETSNLVNTFFQHSAIWRKEPGIQSSSCLYLTYESIRICSLLLQPIVPSYAGKILDRLGIPLNERHVGSIAFAGRSKTKLSRQLGKDIGAVMLRIQLEKKTR